MGDFTRDAYLDEKKPKPSATAAERYVWLGPAAVAVLMVFLLSPLGHKAVQLLWLWLTVSAHL